MARILRSTHLKAANLPGLSDVNSKVPVDPTDDGLLNLGTLGNGKRLRKGRKSSSGSSKIVVVASTRPESSESDKRLEPTVPDKTASAQEDFISKNVLDEFPDSDLDDEIDRNLQNHPAASSNSAIPNLPGKMPLVEQFTNCLMDFYSEDIDTFLLLTKKDNYESFPEFLFGGDSPLYLTLDGIFSFSIETIEGLPHAQYKRYKVFLKSGFQSSERFRTCLDENDLSKPAEDALKVIESDGSSSAHESVSKLSSILSGSVQISDLSAADKDDLLLSLISRLASLEKSLDLFKSVFKDYANQSTKYINKISTSKSESKSQAMAQSISGYGSGVWFPVIRDRNVDFLPQSDDYIPGSNFSGVVVKLHKEPDLSKKKWWAKAKSVELACLPGTDHLANLYKQTFPEAEYQMLKQFFGMVQAEAKDNEYHIPMNLKTAAEDLAAFVSMMSKREEAHSASDSQIMAAGIDPTESYARFKFQRWLGGKDQQQWMEAVVKMFKNAHYQAKRKNDFELLVDADYEEDVLVVRATGRKRKLDEGAMFNEEMVNFEFKDNV